MAIAERAAVQTAGSVLKYIALVDNAPLPPIRANHQWMDVERITNDTHATLYVKIVVTQGVNAGKWRITTTITDLAGAELTAAKAGVVTAADRALLEGVRMALNGLFFLANDVRTRTGAATITKAQFANTVSTLNDFSSQDVADFLVSKI